MNQIQLKEQDNNFKKNKFAIIRYWINKESIILILNTRKIDKEIFIKRYAFGLLDYYIDLISENITIGKSLSTNDFLNYLNKQDVKPEELFILCTGLKNALLEFLNELNKVYNLASKKENAKLLSMVTEKTIENFGNILALLQDNVIRNQWATASDLQATNVDGNVKDVA